MAMGRVCSMSRHTNLTLYWPLLVPDMEIVAPMDYAHGVIQRDGDGWGDTPYGSGDGDGNAPYHDEKRTGDGSGDSGNRRGDGKSPQY